MNTRLIICGFFLMIFLFDLEADINDYLVGLKAYKDGFNDIAKENLENYLSHDNERKNEIFAHYILAHIYFDEKDYKKVIAHIDLVEGKKDERININEISNMKMYALVNTNCADAKKYLSKHLDDEIFSIYFQSECKKDDTFISILCNNKSTANIKLKVMYNLSNINGNIDNLFNCLDLKGLNNSDLKDLGLHFYKQKTFAYFWKIYDIYRDDMLVNLALERFWFLENNDEFLKTFQDSYKKYAINRVNSCRALKIYNEKNLKYDCNILDGCLNNGKDLYVAKVACYLEHNQVGKLNEYIKRHKGNRSLLDALCSYGQYIISEEIYDKDILENLSKCSNRAEYAKILLENDRYNDIFLVLENPIKEEEFFYIALAYRKMGNNIRFNEMKKNIKNVELLKTLNNY